MGHPAGNLLARKRKASWSILPTLNVLVSVLLAVGALNLLVSLNEQKMAYDAAQKQLEYAERALRQKAEAVDAADSTVADLRQQLAVVVDVQERALTPEAVAGSAGLRRASPKMGSESARWAPLVLPACTPGMSPHYAPCLVGKPENPGLVYGEELVYPAFSIKEPGFVREEHAATWRNAARMFAPNRYHLMNGRAYYTVQHAQNLVLRNVAFMNDPPTDQWGDRACMGGQVSHRALKPMLPDQPLNYSGRVVLANTPDSWSLQHFADLATKIMVQTEAWRHPDTRIVTGMVGSPLIEDAWEVLATRVGQEVLHTPGNFTAEELVFSCRCPITHPYFHERLRELMHLPEPTPLQDRKVVLYLSRNGKGSESDPGSADRRVTNEAAVLEAIQAVLDERNQGERLVIFDKDQYPTSADLASLMGRSVSAIVGPHGSAFFNSWWAAPGTFLLEFMPMQRFATVLWEELSVAGLRYWVLPVESSPPQHDMEVDPSLVAQALREQLGGPFPPEVHPYYAWDLAELM